jgi:hypothetical protein
LRKTVPNWYWRSLEISMKKRKLPKNGNAVLLPELLANVAFLNRTFWPRVNKDGPIPANRPELGPCWIWTGGTGSGYGVVGYRYHRYRAHRISYLLAKGPIPAGLEPDHLCCVRPCVNPDHLEPVTHRVNLIRGGVGQHSARKTHCPRNHPLVDGNLKPSRLKRGKRECLTCSRERRNKPAA